MHGTTEIAAEPEAVAALGPGDGDAVLSLGVQPVAVVAPPGGMPSWEQQLVVGDVRVLDDPDTAALAAAEPDLIIDTGDIDEATYNKLGGIAPTVTRPQNAAPGWAWQNQLTWIGRILGRAGQAQRLIDGAAAKQAELRAANPAFDGKSIEVVNVADAGITATLSGSAAADYLEGLGFRYNDDLKRNPTDTADVRPIPDPEVLNQAPTDVRIVVRTDAGARNGSYNELPKPFTTYRGATVIVDDPAVIAALGTGGYAATEYLNSMLVEAPLRDRCIYGRCGVAGGLGCRRPASDGAAAAQRKRLASRFRELRSERQGLRHDSMFQVPGPATALLFARRCQKRKTCF